MATALGFSYHGFRVESWRNSIPARVDRFQILCNSSPPHSAGADEPQSLKEESEAQLVLLEKYGNGTSKRYVVESDSQIRAFLEDYFPENDVFQDSHTAETGGELSWLPKVIKDFVLPAGFPGTTAAASAAAIRWVSKDGIGAVGRLFIGQLIPYGIQENNHKTALVIVVLFNSGGRFGTLFDDDPKQWRLYADFIGSTGSIFDLSTQLYPAYFLPLASLGNLAKALGRGLRDPSFRVIQNHFAISGNLGEVSAKEEVWEVAAELVGLALGILALLNQNQNLGYTWYFIIISYVGIHMRVFLLVNFFFLYQKVPGINDCNRMENILVWERFVRPKITFGVSLEEMVTGKKRGSMMRMLLKLYAEEKYFLVVNQLQTKFEVIVAFKEGATSLSVLRSVWQSHWLHQNWSRLDDTFSQLERSLIELKNGFDDFWVQLEDAGWDTNQINLKVPKEILIQEYHAI
ncbi:hypothetical protein CDL12_02212 [Handroanthus impetiginosus]|uniref:Protein root UVB sensitive 5 n=1 Tax=Handroanthus impetiginosus TaxID=429701 RepID=A0A2G9I5I6_9LAMI|nr:hypothetical protein CDL12_02212 [Handroanthus impetiginosus]